MATKKKTTKATAAEKTTAKKTAKKTPAKGADVTKKQVKKKTGMSAIDAAAKVLGESKEPMTPKQMIEAMAAKGYWKSPAGKTTHATLYSAILREIGKKGNEARFAKVDRGQFALKSYEVTR